MWFSCELGVLGTKILISQLGSSCWFGLTSGLFYLNCIYFSVKTCSFRNNKVFYNHSDILELTRSFRTTILKVKVKVKSKDTFVKDKVKDKVRVEIKDNIVRNINSARIVIGKCFKYERCVRPGINYDLIRAITWNVSSKYLILSNMHLIIITIVTSTQKTIATFSLSKKDLL